MFNLQETSYLLSKIGKVFIFSTFIIKRNLSSNTYYFQMAFQPIIQNFKFSIESKNKIPTFKNTKNGTLTSI